MISTDSRPLHVRRQSVQVRISEIERAIARDVAALAEAKRVAAQLSAELLLELERAPTIPAPPPAADPFDFEVELDTSNATNLLHEDLLADVGTRDGQFGGGW